MEFLQRCFYREKIGVKNFDSKKFVKLLESIKFFCESYDIIIKESRNPLRLTEGRGNARNDENANKCFRGGVLPSNPNKLATSKNILLSVGKGVCAVPLFEYAGKGADENAK